MRATLSLSDSLRLLGLQDSEWQAAGESLLLQVRRAYLRRARLLHPDKGGSEGDFIALQDAYKTVQSAIESGELSEQTKKQSSATTFSLYKDAIRQYNEAVNAYFSHRKQVNLNPNDEDYMSLRETLTQLRSQFVNILVSDPNGEWSYDVREKIKSIDNWLR